MHFVGMSAAPTPCALAAKLTLIAVLRKEGAQSQLQRPLYSIGGQGVQVRSAGEVFAVRIVGATRLLVDGCPSFQRRCGFGSPDRWGRSVQGLSLPSRQLEDRTTSIGEGGVPCWGVVPASGVYRDQPRDAEPGCDAVLYENCFTVSAKSGMGV